MRPAMLALLLSLGLAGCSSLAFEIVGHGACIAVKVFDYVEAQKDGGGEPPQSPYSHDELRNN